MMMNLLKRPIRMNLAAAMCAASTISGLIAAPGAFAAGGIKAAYVETVIPAKPFTSFVSLEIFPIYVGVRAGVLGISSITLTNPSNAAARVEVQNRVEVAGTECLSGTQSRQIFMVVFVQARSTLHLPFPAPISIEPIGGMSCVGFSYEGALIGQGSPILITVNGFIN